MSNDDSDQKIRDIEAFLAELSVQPDGPAPSPKSVAVAAAAETEIERDKSTNVHSMSSLVASRVHAKLLIADTTGWLRQWHIAAMFRQELKLQASIRGESYLRNQMERRIASFVAIALFGGAFLFGVAAVGVSVYGSLHHEFAFPQATLDFMYKFALWSLSPAIVYVAKPLWNRFAQ